MEKIKRIIREQIQKLFEEGPPQKMKTQANFDWRKDYSEDFKNNLEIKGNNVILYHYGTDEGTGILSPKFFGKHSYTSADVKQLNAHRVFFYVHREDKEYRVTGSEYVVKYPLNKLYPFNADPYYFYEECLEEYNSEDTGLSVSKQLLCIGAKVEEAGFDGMILNWGGTHRVDIWKDVPV